MNLVSNPLACIRIEKLSAESRIQLQNFYQHIQPLIKQIATGELAKSKIVEYYLAERRRYTPELKQALDALIQTIQISKGYISQVQTVIDAKADPFFDQELLPFYDQHGLSLQYLMTKLPDSELRKQQKTGKPYTKSALQKKVYRVNQRDEKQPTPSEQKDAELLERYPLSDYRCLQTSKSREVFHVGNRDALIRALMQHLHQKRFKDTNIENQLVQLKSMINDYLSLDVYSCH